MAKRTTKGRKALVDTPTIVTGLMTILVIGFFLMIAVNLNTKVQSNVASSIASSQIDENDTGAVSAARNASAGVNNSYLLASNLPLILIAVLMIMVLIGVAAALT